MKAEQTLKREYFTKKREREREIDNVQFLGESHGFPLQKLVLDPFRSEAWLCCLNSKIINILYDRHGPNPGDLLLMTF